MINCRITKLHARFVQEYKFPLSDMNQGAVGDMAQMGITESFSVKRQVLLSAAESAEMILRVDDIIRAAPRKRTEDRGHC